MSKVINNQTKIILIILAMALFSCWTFNLGQSADVPQNYQQLTTGMELKIPQDNVLKVDENYTFFIHAFYTATGNPIDGKTSCHFWLYNSTGEVVYNTTMTYVIGAGGGNFNVYVLGGNLSTVGDYYYNVQCEDDTVGGFASSIIHITPNGEEATVGRAIFYIGILFLLVVFLIMSIGVFMKYDDNLLAKVSMFGLSYLLLIAITFVGWQTAIDFLTSSPFLIEIFRILFFVLIIGFFPLLIGAFAWYIIMITKIKEIQNLMEHGMSSDEAERRVKGRKK
jgi:hypothetical protein